MKWVIGIVLAVWAGWSLAFPTHTLRWRLTVEVETPQGVRSGSSVLESSFFRTFGGPGGCASELKGQAVFIDLGDGKHIIALLTHGPRGDNVDLVARLPLRLLSDTSRSPCQSLFLPGARSGTIDLKPPLIPTLVNFADLGDPKTARVLDPFNGSFEVAFGPGYRFGRATIAVVPAGVWPLNAFGLWGEAVSRGIETTIPFLVSEREPLRRVSRDMPPRFQTGFSQFLRE